VAKRGAYESKKTSFIGLDDNGDILSADFPRVPICAAVWRLHKLGHYLKAPSVDRFLRFGVQERFWRVHDL